jgi:hypothetical protein
MPDDPTEGRVLRFRPHRLLIRHPLTPPKLRGTEAS